MIYNKNIMNEINNIIKSQFTKKRNNNGKNTNMFIYYRPI